MRLKRIEISGFKTFRDKVTFEFSPGVSGIIGPNGCGKSNIVDALRWVMGEQRVRAIRGKKMDDVIFSGSDSASPLDMAEVTMTMTSNGQPFPGSYCESEEVTIGRRLFRDGESEYYINRVPCRLLDVKEFFMDSGVGARTYSLVEQNSVANLVEAKPEDRRQFIEEAAGIAKYKSRKEAALRKMEATKQNMIRLHDIIKEVKTQLNSVSRQAKRAEQYKILKKEIKEAETSIALNTYCDLEKKRLAMEKDKDNFLNKEKDITAGLKSKEASFEEAKLVLLENEEIISRSREELYGTKNTINIKEQGIEFSQGRIVDINEKRQRNVLEISEREKKLAEISREIDALAESAKLTETEITDLKNRLDENQQELENLRSADRKLTEELEEEKVSYIDVVAEKAKLKNMEANIAKSVEDIVRRQDRYLREMEENNKRCDVLHRILHDLGLGVKDDESKGEELKTRQVALMEQLNETKVRLTEIETIISTAKEESGRKSERLTSLQEFQEGYTWCSEGIKSIMTARKSGDLNDFSGDVFLGLVADHIDVPREYETAVEAVLGERLQYVVVKSQDDGVKAIDYLKQSSRGRGAFVPLEVRNNYNNEMPLAEHLQDTVRLLDKVMVKDDFREIIAYLLGDVLLIPNLKSGVSLWRQNGFRGTFVTPEGDVINSQGVLTGGSINKGDRSLLANKREIGELKNDILRLNVELNSYMDIKDKLNRECVRLDEELQNTKTDIHGLEIQINGRRKDLERFEDEMKRIEQRRHILEFDNETMISERKDALNKMERIKEEQSLQEERERIINEKIEEFKGKQSVLKTDLDRREGDFTSSKVLLASKEEKIESERRERFRLETTRESLVKDIEEKQKEEVTLISQVEELVKNIDIEKGNLSILYEQYRTVEQTIELKSSQQQERDCLLKELEKEVKDIRQDLEQVIRAAGELEISIRETAFQMDSLKNSMHEKHYIDISELSREYACLGEEELQQITAKLEKARATVGNFGEVNLLAISEYEELKVRHDFLTTQDADITASLESLQHTIERINRISKARFAETFEAINACFQDMFSRIFPGGKGELFLTDGNDMLETGVDINIQIAGKRTRNVSLLSGGEKSLAAIALIFAILQYRPTPFLVLDEVDAALDDANISLFNKLIKDISQNSQIIMVTHNKKSMEVAENLYGITMQNKGISTLVSVSLN